MAKNVFKAAHNTLGNWAAKATGLAKGVASSVHKVTDSVSKSISTNGDATSIYLHNNDKGKVVKLTDIEGVSNALVHTELKAQIDQINQELLGKWLQADTPYVSDSNANKLGNWGSTKNYDLTWSQLFFVGDGQLFGYLKSDGERAQIHYYVRDQYADPLDIKKEFLGTPYKISWDMDSQWYSIMDAKNTVGVVGSHSDYSWMV